MRSTLGQPGEAEDDHRAPPIGLSQLGPQLSALRNRLDEETEQHPLRTVALAVGAGYVLGGGLFSKLSARLLGVGLRVGLRMAFIPFVTQSLAVWSEDLFRSQRDRDRNRDIDVGQSPPSGVGPFAAETTIPKKPSRQTDPKENNP